MHVTILAHCMRVLAVALGAAAAAGLAFALAGAASADHDDATHFPAEAMAHGSFAEAVADPSAFGGEALRFSDPGRATRSVALPSEGERVVIRARNGSAHGPRSAVGLRVLVDGKAVGEKFVSSASYAYYSFDASVPKGTHKIAVEAYSLGGKERAYLDVVRVVHRDPPPDADADGAADASDNCPGTPNADQKDSDGDGTGDACDSQDNRDSDSDGVQNHQDNCVDAANAGQANKDGDGTGDACDPTDDRSDLDGDGLPDAEDPDRDGDGFANGADNRPDTHNPGQPDIDGDKVGDFADPDKDGDGIVNHEDPDPTGLDVPVGGGTTPANCEVNIAPGQDIDQVVNSDPGTTATKFCLAKNTSTHPAYYVDNPVILKNGDVLSGPIATQRSIGQVYYGVPQAKISGPNVEKVISMQGSSTVQWLEVVGGQGRVDTTRAASSCPSSPLSDGAGCPVVGEGVGIAMGQASGLAEVNNVYVHDNDANGINNANGRIMNSHFTDNTGMDAYLGVTAAGIKGVQEFEASYNFVHDEQGIGIWHDHALSGEANIPEMASNPGGGTWVHHNVILNNGRYGIRFEYSPRDAREGQHLSTPSFLAEQNRVAGTKVNAGASHDDAQNGTWRNNIFGPQTISGVTYGHNFNQKALVIRDSGRSDRTDTWNTVVQNNTLNGEIIQGCTVADTVCSGNS